MTPQLQMSASLPYLRFRTCRYIPSQLSIISKCRELRASQRLSCYCCRFPKRCQHQEVSASAHPWLRPPSHSRVRGYILDAISRLDCRIAEYFVCMRQGPLLNFLSDSHLWCNIVGAANYICERLAGLIEDGQAKVCGLEWRVVGLGCQ